MQGVVDARVANLEKSVNLATLADNGLWNRAAAGGILVPVMDDKDAP